VVGAACAFLGAICYSELGVNLPSSGGEYVYLTRAFGPTWGFMTGWASFFAGFSAPIAAAALAFSGYLGYFFPRFRPESAPVILGRGDWTVQLGWPQLVACALVAVFTLLNIFGLQRAARVQNVLTAFKIAILVGFVLLGLHSSQGDTANFSATAVRTVQTPLAAQFAISLFWLYVAYSGWNAATYVAEELRHPAKTLPVALAIGTAVVTVLYLALNAVFIYASPLELLKGRLAVGAFAASRLFGPDVAGFFSGLMALSLMATVNAMVTIGPRVYYAMAKNGAFPARAANVHPKWHTPVAALVAQGVCTMVLTMTPFPQLVVYIGFTLNFFAVMSVAALLFLRRGPGWRKLKVVSFCYPLFPALFIVVGAWMTFYGVQLKPYVSLAAVLTIATGALFYHWRWKPRAGAETAPVVENYGK
jgi:APA family basic amino acid/polyamine antiporter